MPNDLRWMEIVRWSVFAMVNAEELGLTSTTIDRALASDDPDVQRFVGKSGGFGAMLGLDAEWAYQDRQAGRQLRRELRPQHQAARDRARRQPAVEGRRRAVRAGPAVISPLELAAGVDRIGTLLERSANARHRLADRWWSPSSCAIVARSRSRRRPTSERAASRQGSTISAARPGSRSLAGPLVVSRRATPTPARSLVGLLNTLRVVAARHRASPPRSGSAFGVARLSNDLGRVGDRERRTSR